MQPPRGKNFIIDKMIHLGLIADRSEILPSQRRRAKKSSKNFVSDIGENDSDRESDAELNMAEYGGNTTKGTARSVVKNIITTTKHQTLMKKPLNYAQLSVQLSELEPKFQTVFAWLEESLNDAAKDLVDDGPSSDPDDCVPLVPFASDQRDAMEHTDFQLLLTGLGLQPPAAGSEMYWRIPHNLTADDISLRARIVSGTFDFDAHGQHEVVSAADDSDTHSEDDYDFEANRLKLQRQQQLNDLVYNNSDDEASKMPTPQPHKSFQKETTKFDVFDMVRQSSADEKDQLLGASTSTAADERSLARRNRIDDSSDEDDDVSATRKPPSQRQNAISDSDDDDTNVTVIAPNQRNKRERSKDDSDDNSDTTSAAPVFKTATKRKRMAVIEDDDDDE